MAIQINHPALKRPVGIQHLHESRCLDGRNANAVLSERIVVITEMSEAGWTLVSSSTWTVGEQFFVNDTFRWGQGEAPSWFELSAQGGADAAVSTDLDFGASDTVDPTETDSAGPAPELGDHVSLDEDVYDGATVPPRVFVFDAYDSDAPAESNCTLVDPATGDWTVRGIGELVAVDSPETTDGTATD